MMDDYKVHEAKCPECGHTLDFQSISDMVIPDEETRIEPKAGDVTVCIGCTKVLEFDEELNLKVSTDEHLSGLDDDFQVKLWKVRDMLARMRGGLEAPGAPDPEEEEFRKCNCGVCMEPIGEGGHINVVFTDYRAEWPYPVAGNVEDGDVKSATTFVHDKCMESGKIRFVVEFLEGGGEKYHSVDNLEKVVKSQESLPEGPN